MSWHLSHRLTNKPLASMRLTAMHKAVSIGILYSVGATVLLPMAQAATMGKTVVTSAQHEPLVAIISVADINAEDFSASLANPMVYQQMGLTPTNSMSVRFVPTSATTGTVVISTTQPVSMPFADVILAINDNGQRNTIPKTLLMPLAKSVPIKQPNQVIATAQKPNLPIVSDRTEQPLTVKRGAPPPLFASPNSQVPDMQMPSTRMANAQAQMVMPVSSASINSPIINRGSVNIPIASSMTRNSVTNNQATGSVNIAVARSVTRSATNSNLDNSSNVSSENNNTSSRKASNPTQSINALSDVASSAATLNRLANNAQTSLPAPIVTQTATNVDANIVNTAINTTDNISKPFNILSIQVSRQIRLSNPTAVPSRPLVLANNAPKLIARPNPLIANTAIKADIDSNDPDVDADTKNAALASETVASSTLTANAKDAISSPSTETAAISYTVQRNDNLWIIAQQIALQNDVDVQAVMTRIQQQNPGAFIGKDANRLKANAQLSLPDYKTAPSQKSLQVAIAAQRQYYRQSDKPLTASTTDQPDDKKPTTTEVATDQITATNLAIAKSASLETSKTADKPKTITKTLPQAQFSVLAPGRDGSASGIQSKAGSGINTNISTDILSTLQASRQRTAATAQQVQATNSTLSGYVQKLQLQNQKLAELEARLKKLRNQ